MTTAVKPTKLSAQLEQWRLGEGEKTLGTLVHTFGEMRLIRRLERHSSML